MRRKDRFSDGIYIFRDGMYISSVGMYISRVGMYYEYYHSNACIET